MYPCIVLYYFIDEMYTFIVIYINKEQICETVSPEEAPQTKPRSGTNGHPFRVSSTGQKTSPGSVSRSK